MVMPDSSVFCNLCCHDTAKSNERVLLVKGWKQFDVIAEIAKSRFIFEIDREQIHL